MSAPIVPSAGPRLALTGSHDSPCEVVRAVAGSAADRPHSPAIFFQSGIEWRWIGWRELADRIAATSRLLACAAGQTEGNALAGAEVAFPSRPTVETLVLDLALTDLGAVPLPLPGRAAGDLREAATAWVGDAAEPRLEGSPTPRGPAAARWRQRRALGAAALTEGVARPSSETPSSAPSAPAGRSARTASWWRRPADREIVVDVLELERPLCRAAVAWTLGRGGALVLAHERASLPASARWARPTRLWASTAEGRFDRMVEATVGLRRPRRERLASAAWCGDEPPSAAALAALAAAGVPVREWVAPIVAEG